MAGKIVIHLLRVALGLVFLAAGVVKIWDFEQKTWGFQFFYQTIVNYHLTSSDFAMVSAFYLPWLEVIIGGALLLRRATAGAAAICALLMGVFIAALGSAWYRELDISCGCFGRENATVDFPLLLTRDVALLVAALAVAWSERRRFPDEGHRVRSAS